MCKFASEIQPGAEKKKKWGSSNDENAWNPWGCTHTHTHTHTSILNNEIIKFNIENKAKLIAVFGGRF